MNIDTLLQFLSSFKFEHQPKEIIMPKWMYELYLKNTKHPSGKILFTDIPVVEGKDFLIGG